MNTPAALLSGRDDATDALNLKVFTFFETLPHLHKVWAAHAACVSS
jgi:hypothetical protein